MTPWQMYGSEDVAGKWGLLTEISTEDFTMKQQWMEAKKIKIHKFLRLVKE